MNDEILIKEIETYINSDKTIKETAEDLGISKRTLQLHIRKLKVINIDLYNTVLEKQKSNMKKGRIKGATIGKRTMSHSQEEVEEIVKEMIKNEMTYEEASIKYNIPTSTLYELVHSRYVDEELQNLLSLLAVKNKHNATSEINERIRNK